MLLPFSWIYGAITWVRNKCYDLGWLKSTRFSIPVISIGNLAVGGMGKTPVTEYLVRLLKEYKVAILSRGYGRDTKGFILADSHATAQSIGDEPLQYYRKFPGISVAVCEDRCKGIRQLETTHQVILLDDAFQHRRVKPGYSLLINDYASLFKPAFLLPAGMLRESLAGYRRAQHILITKSPEPVPDEALQKVNSRFPPLPHQLMQFAHLHYGRLLPVYPEHAGTFSSELKKYEVFVLTGIARPETLLAYLKAQGASCHHMEYPDHHVFRQSEIIQWVKAFHASAAKNKLLLTTEKDSQRLLDEKFKDLLLNLPLYYIPIEVKLGEKDALIFEKNILEYVTSTKRIR